MWKSSSSSPSMWLTFTEHSARGKHYSKCFTCTDLLMATKGWEVGTIIIPTSCIGELRHDIKVMVIVDLVATPWRRSKNGLPGAGTGLCCSRLPGSPLCALQFPWLSTHCLGVSVSSAPCFLPFLSAVTHLPNSASVTHPSYPGWLGGASRSLSSLFM